MYNVCNMYLRMVSMRTCHNYMYLDKLKEKTLAQIIFLGYMPMHRTFLILSIEYLGTRNCNRGMLRIPICVIRTFLPAFNIQLYTRYLP